MALFDEDRRTYPKKWSEMSFDFKMFFAYHLCMMAMLLLQSLLSLRIEFICVFALAITITGLSIRRRRIMGWHWAGVNSKQLLRAGCSVLAICIVMFCVAPAATEPMDVGLLPWYLAVIAIAVFTMLEALNVVRPSEAVFLQDCISPLRDIVDVAPVDPLWKRAVRGVFVIAFISVWVYMASFFYFLNVAIQDGAATPNSVQTVAIDMDHGRIHYVTPEQKQRLESLQGFMFAGIPLVILLGALIHFFLSVRLVPNVPTLQDWRAERSSKR